MKEIWKEGLILILLSIPIDLTFFIYLPLLWAMLLTAFFAIAFFLIPYFAEGGSTGLL